MYAGLELYKGSKASKGKRQEGRKSGERSIVKGDSKIEGFLVNIFPRQQEKRCQARDRAAFIDRYK